MMDPAPCPDPWPTRKQTFSSESASQLGLFPVSASGATTPANSPTHALAAGCSSVSPHPVAPISSVTGRSSSHPTWSDAPSLSSQPSRSKPPQAGPHQPSATSSITSDAPVVSPPSSAPQPKRCELRQSPSEVSEQLRRFFHQLAVWFPEPTDDEMNRALNSPQRKHAR